MDSPTRILTSSTLFIFEPQRCRQDAPSQSFSSTERRERMTDGSVTSSTNFDGVWTAHAPLVKHYPIANNHTHDVDVLPDRARIAGSTRNPVAFGMFLERRSVIL